MGTQFERIGRNALQAGFNLIRVLAGREARAVRHTKNMSIDRDGWLPECFIQDDVRCLSTNTRQLDESVPCLWHLAAELVQDHTRERDDVLGLVAPQPDRLDVFGDPCLTQCQHFLWGISDLEKGLGCLVDAHVRRLGREGDSDHERIGVDEVQLCVRIRPVLCQGGVELGRLCFWHGARIAGFAFGG